MFGDKKRWVVRFPPLGGRREGFLLQGFTFDCQGYHSSKHPTLPRPEAGIALATAFKVFSGHWQYNNQKIFNNCFHTKIRSTVNFTLPLRGC